MGTRGLYGLRKNGVDKATYNHFDSYPDYMGKSVVEFLIEHGEKCSHIFDCMELVEEFDKPTDTQLQQLEKMGYNMEECKEHLAPKTQNGQVYYDFWYWLLRGRQGCPEYWAKDAEKYNHTFIVDDIEFIKNSLFCEYAYIYDIDDEMLEFYIGFQTKPDDTNRYGYEPYDPDNDGRYYPCKLVKVFPLATLKKLGVDKIAAKMEAIREAERKEDEADVA